MPHASGETVPLERKVRALSDAGTHGVATQVRRIETHFSFVFLAGQFAYKMKKPVCIDVMDLRTPALRQQSCLEELRLNRRLAADTYLDVVPLTLEADGRLLLNGRGEAVEWLVRMKRLPQDLMLDRAMIAGTVSKASLVAVGELLATFYLHQPGIDLAPTTYVGRLERQILDNRRELQSFDLGQSSQDVDALTSRQLDTLRDCRADAGARAAHRRIVEAHGDLRPEHICLGPPCCVIDCLEFSRELRLLDPFEELAYFTVECRDANQSWVADTVIDVYRTQTGDAVPTALFKLYLSHRATTRAKIAAWHLRDPAITDHAHWAARARQYLIIAADATSDHA